MLWQYRSTSNALHSNRIPTPSNPVPTEVIWLRNQNNTVNCAKDYSYTIKQWVLKY